MPETLIILLYKIEGMSPWLVFVASPTVAYLLFRKRKTWIKVVAIAIGLIIGMLGYYILSLSLTPVYCCL
jgi:hypothetical protein